MALDQSALLEVLEALKAPMSMTGFARRSQTIYQALIEAELTAVIGVAPHERTEFRTAQRNGSRPAVASVSPRRCRAGSCCGPACLPSGRTAVPGRDELFDHPGHRAEQNALLARTQLTAERARLDATLLYVRTGPRRPTAWFSGTPTPTGSGGSIRAPVGGTAGPAARAWPRPMAVVLRPDDLGSRSARRRSETLGRT